MKLTKEIYTAKEVAQLIGLTPPAIRGAIQAGTLKTAGKFNNAYIIRRDDLIEYLEYRERRDNGK